MTVPVPAHDALRRFRALAALAERLALAENARVLDVGGFPGTLRLQLLERFPAWDVHVVDSARGKAEAYTIASGAALPFPDGAFDLVLSSDTLEHVPPPQRPAFLAELLRVSSNAVVLCAPFHQDAVAAIEAALNDAHRAATGRDHPWLGEHVQNVLPILEETHRGLGADRPAAVLLNAPLWDWMLWQWGALARDLGGGLHEAWDACNAQLNDAPDAGRDCVALDAPGAFLAYRAIVVAAKQLPFDPVTPGEARFPSHARESAACIAYSGLMRAFVERMNAPSAGGGAETIDARLREAVVLAEQEAGRWKAQALAPRPSLAERIARKVRGR